MQKWLAAAAAVLVMRAAHAQPATEVTLDQAPGACDAAAIDHAVGALAAAVPHAAVHVTIATERRGSRLVATIAWPARGATREVEARDCDELARSIAVVIATSLEPPAASSVTIAMPDAPPPVPPLVDEPVAVASAAPARARRHAPRAIDVTLGAAGQGTRRGAVVAGARLRQGALSLGVEADAEPAITIDVGAGGAVELSRTRFELVPCAHVGPVALCGIAAAGWVTGRGTQLAGATEVTRPVALAGVRAAVGLALSRRLALDLHVDGLQALTTTRFLVDHMPTWTTDPRELWVGAGVVATFP